MKGAKLIGGKELLKKFQGFNDLLNVEFQDVINDTADHTQVEAIKNIKSKVKNGTGHLTQSMYMKMADPSNSLDLYAEVGNSAEYAGYVEFGTGKKVHVPAEFADIASRIRSQPTKSFEQGLQAIRDWCKMRGIPDNAAYPIFMSILGWKKKKGARGWESNGDSGVSPRPFMYPAYLSAKKYIIKKSDEAIKRLKKKF